MPDEKREAKDIFLEAREKTSPEELAAFLDRACGDAPQLRQRVEVLLQADLRAGKFLARAEPETTFPESLPLIEGPGTLIGYYKLLQQIGEGGFGVVFMAEQQEPVRRMVALKIIKPGMDSRAVVARFEAERQALALMDHPNIAHVFDGGVTDGGRPYFVMELVKGVPITDFCDRNNSSAEERLRLFVDICRAVQHAHQKGIIHRDLKPSNIMITLHDSVPVAKVIDFGVAKAISQRLTEKTLFTAYGQMIGTPLYMSPEQAEMSGLDVDTRSDIYSLGVLLYELLTGCTPLEAEELRDAGYAEMQRIIRETEPPRPSLRLSTSGRRLADVARQRSIDPKGLRRLLRGEMDWIVMKALEKDRRRRYETATAFAADIERFLCKEPVEAGPPTAGYRLRKFVARRKALFAAGVTVASALLLGIVGTSGGMLWALGERRKADEARSSAESAELETRRQLYTSDMYTAERAWDRNNILLVQTLLERYRGGSGHEHLRTWEWYYLWHLWKKNADLLKVSFPVEAVSIAISANGQRVATSSPYGAFVTVWDVSVFPPRKLKDFGKEERDRWSPTPVALSPSGHLLAYSDSSCSTLIIADVETEAKKSVLLGDGVTLTALAFSPRRDVIAAATTDNKVKTCDAATGAILGICDRHKSPVKAIRIFPDCDLAASGDAEGNVFVWRLDSGESAKSLAVSSGGIHGLAVSPNGRLIAAASTNRTVAVWDWEAEKVVHTFGGFRDEVRSVDFSSDGKWLAAGVRGGLLRLWDAKTFQELDPIRGYHGESGFAFLPDDRLMFLNRHQNRRHLSVCRLDDHRPLFTPAVEVWATTTVGCRRDELILATMQGNEHEDRRVKFGSTIELRQVKEGSLQQLSPLSPGFPIGCLAVSADGVLAAGDAAGSRVLMFPDLEAKNPTLLNARIGRRASSAVFSGDGIRLAVGFCDGQVAVWSRDGQPSVWKVVNEWRAHEAPVSEVAFYPEDDTKLVTGGQDRSLKVWNTGTAELVRQPRDCVSWVFAIAFSRNGEKMAVASHFAGDIDFWDTTTGRHCVLRGHSQTAHKLVFSNDERTLISASADCTLRFWDLSTGRERFAIDIGPKIFSSMAISPDETVIAGGTRDGMIRLFRRATEEEVKAAGW